MRLRRYLISILPFVHIALVTSASTYRESSFGSKSVDTAAHAVNSQAKRDISLSYTATDIDSKEGARFKTITVIKNLNKDGTSEKLTINPELHKNENWADAFRDNFDSYGTIPDVPDIDDLFEFMNKKSKTKSKPKIENKTEKSSSPSPAQTTISMTMPPRKPFKGKVEQNEKPVVEPTVESFGDEAVTMMVKAMPSMAMPMSMPSTMTMTAAAVTKNQSEEISNIQKSSPTVEKIKGDAELLPTAGNGPKRQSSNIDNTKSASTTRSQSLLVNKERLREQLVNVNYSTPQHSVHQYFENYVQENAKGYDYTQPCINAPSSSVSVTTPSGRTYDIPRTNSAAGSNNGIMNPYIAPSVSKRPPAQQTPAQQPQLQPQPSLPPLPINTIQSFPPYNQQTPTYSVNSILPPIQPTPNYVGPPQVPTLRQPIQISQTGQQTTASTQQPQFGNNFSTSQRPYVAPNLRNGLGYSRGPPPTPIYNVVTGGPNYRTNVFGFNKPSIGRSRGLKY